MKKRRQRTNRSQYEVLEKRQLLAGDVSAFLAGDALIVAGDNIDNEIQIAVNDSGVLSVSGQNGTTINGTEAFNIDMDDAVLQDLRIYLAGGDDSVFVEDVELQRRIIVRGGSGDDSIGVFDVAIGDDLYVDSGSGSDQISIDRPRVGDNLVVRSRGGEDSIGIDDSVIRGRTIVDSGSSHDRVVIRDSVHQSRVRINTSGGSDFFSADGITVNGPARISTGGRVDNVFVNNSDFNAAVTARGGGGQDILEVTGGSTFDVAPRVFSLEGNDVVGGIPQTDRVFTDLITSGARLATITELAVLTPELSTLVGALQVTGLDAALQADGPFTVFAPLNSAFNAISNVVDGLTTAQLSNVLQFHVAAGAISSSELVMMNSVDTLLGQSFSVDTTNGVTLNGNASLAATDIRAKNGVVHLLNDVLVPVL